MKKVLYAIIILLSIAYPLARADNCYINDTGNTLIIHDNDNGRAQVIFNFENDAFTAEGPRTISIVLTQYVGIDKTRFMDQQNGPEVAIEFSKNLAKVKLSKSSPWAHSNISGNYHQLELSFIREKLQNNAQFKEVEQQMLTALEALIAVTPINQQEELLNTQTTWLTKVAKDKIMDILFNNFQIQKDPKKIPQAVSEAYIDVISSRTRWLNILTQQQQYSHYIPTLKGIIYKGEQNSQGIPIMFRPNEQKMTLHLCESESPNCIQADQLLQNTESQSVQISCRFNLTTGCIQESNEVILVTKTP